MFGKDSKILNFINVKRANFANKTHRQQRLAPMPNDVFVLSESISSKQMTREELEKEIKIFLKNDKFEISCNRAIFENLDKVDLNNGRTHLKNILILLGGASNSNDRIMQNGYFSSDEGAQAFDILAKLFDNKSQMTMVSPLSIVLADYTPETVFILQKRGLLNSSMMSNSTRLNNLAKMSDEEYTNFQKRVADSISATGYTFEELSASLEKDLSPMVESYAYDYFQKYYLNEEQVVAQKEFLPILKELPFDFKGVSIVSILGKVNIDNIDSCKNIISQLSQRKDVLSDDVSAFLSFTNKKTEETLSELLQNKDIPVFKIIQYCKDDDFKNGLVSKEDVLNKINNDSYIKSVNAIKSSKVNLKPQDTMPKQLNPHNIEADALALVHMTKYEPENGKLLSTRDKLGGSRNSVHFTLNHPVTAHRAGYWDDCTYAVIMPYSSTVKLNGDGKFIEGMPNDIYTNGSVKIPEGSVIVKHNPELHSGSVNIAEHPSLKGVKYIETSEIPHSLVPAVIEKMGYTHMQADGPMGLFSYGTEKGETIEETMENFVAWKDFCNDSGLKVTRHTGSAGEVAEQLIENTAQLCVNNSWINQKNKHNYKKELLTYLDFARQLERKGYFVSFDLDALEKILKESKTPQVAVDRMPKELGFHPTLKYDYFNDCTFNIPIDLYAEWYNSEDSLDCVREFLVEKEMKYR